nr:nucleolar and coiled-body phosphoprotein 1-like [Aegilops tauschii subsp. strangulata]
MGWSAESKVPAKKGKKKEVLEAKEGLRRKVRPGNRSGDAAASSVQDGGEDEDEDKEESASSHSKKRAASEDIKEVQPSMGPKRRCRPKLVQSDNSDSHTESDLFEKVPEKEPRVKPPASSPPHERHTEQTSEGTSPPAELADSGSMAHSVPPLIPEEVEEVRSQRTPPPPNTKGEADAVMAEASSMAATANAAALEEMDRKLKLSDKELDLVNKRLDEAQAAAAEVDGLKEALKKAEAEAAKKKITAEKAVVELEKAKLAAEQHEARVTEVQVELQDAAKKLEALEKGRRSNPPGYPRRRKSSRRRGLTREVSEWISAKPRKLQMASLLAATSHAAEVFGLKQILERAEEEFSRVKKQLEDKQVS